MVTYDMAFHNYWLGNIKKVKGVKGAVHIKTAHQPPQHVVSVTTIIDGKREVVRYKLDTTPTIKMEDEYLFIISDLKKKTNG